MIASEGERGRSGSLSIQGFKSLCNEERGVDVGELCFGRGRRFPRLIRIPGWLGSHRLVSR